MKQYKLQSQVKFHLIKLISPYIEVVLKNECAVIFHSYHEHLSLLLQTEKQKCNPNQVRENKTQPAPVLKAATEST